MTDDQLLSKAIVIVGAPRSGTTFLGNVLQGHSKLAYASEPRLIWRYGNDHKSDMLRRSDARPEIRRYIRQQFARHVHEGGGERLLEKIPSNSLRMEFVDEVFPDCLFIHTLRNGVESVLSIRRFWENKTTGLPKVALRQRLKEIRLRQVPYYSREFMKRALGKVAPKVVGSAMWGPRLPGMEQMVRDMDLLEVCALQWRMCVEHACRFGRQLPGERYLEVRLEDAGEEQLKRIVEFCRLEPAEEVYREFRSRYDASQPNRRTKEADAEEIEQARQAIEPTMKWLGLE